MALLLLPKATSYLLTKTCTMYTLVTGVCDLLSHTKWKPMSETITYYIIWILCFVFLFFVWVQRKQEMWTFLLKYGHFKRPRHVKWCLGMGAHSMHQQSTDATGEAAALRRTGLYLASHWGPAPICASKATKTKTLVGQAWAGVITHVQMLAFK